MEHSLFSYPECVLASLLLIIISEYLQHTPCGMASPCFDCSVLSLTVAQFTVHSKVKSRFSIPFKICPFPFRVI